MNGKVIVAFLVLPAVLAGAALYYLQFFSMRKSYSKWDKLDVAIVKKTSFQSY